MTASVSSDPAVDDALWPQAVAYFAQRRKPGISGLQRTLHVTWERARQLVEGLERAGLVSAPDAQGRRHYLQPAPANEALTSGEAALFAARRLRDGEALRGCPQAVILELLQMHDAARAQLRQQLEDSDIELLHGVRALNEFTSSVASGKAQPEALVRTILDAARRRDAAGAMRDAHERARLLREQSLR